MTAGTVWSAVTSRPVLALGALLAGIILAGECRGHREDNRVLTVPVRAEDTKAAADMERGPLSDTCPDVTALKPTAKERKRIERDYPGTVLKTQRLIDRVGGGAEDTQQPLPVGTHGSALLAEKILPRLPFGGRALVTLPPGGGEVEFTVKPNSAPFFSFQPTYSVSALVGYRDGLLAQRAEVSADWLSAGRLHLVSSAGFERYGDTSGTFVLAGVKLQF